MPCCISPCGSSALRAADLSTSCLSFILKNSDSFAHFTVNSAKLCQELQQVCRSVSWKSDICLKPVVSVFYPPQSFCNHCFSCNFLASVLFLKPGSCIVLSSKRYIVLLQKFVNVCGCECSGLFLDIETMWQSLWKARFWRRQLETWRLCIFIRVQNREG